MVWLSPPRLVTSVVLSEDVIPTKRLIARCVEICTDAVAVRL